MIAFPVRTRRLFPPRALASAFALLVVTALAAPEARAQAATKLGPALAGRLATHPTETVSAWVFFSDRAGAERDPAALESARRAWPARAIERRRLRGAVRDLTASDLPVHAPYVRALAARGLTIRGVSRWLNAASVQGSAREIAANAVLPFVARVELVPRGERMRDPIEPDAPGAPSPARASAAPGAPRLAAAAPGDTGFYGATFRQLSMMQAPALHQYGLTGQGVLVAMLDTGFRTTHRALSAVPVVARRDFIHQDHVVDDEPGQDAPGAGQHGTWTLGCVAALRAGTYAGGAFGVSVALAKTEDVSSETPAEMDYWQFAVEWADSLGADVVSSSLGYSEFDNPAESYTYADMDGRTTVVARAAAEAARRGITVVNSAGNTGASPWRFIISPADADSMLAVGAVDSNGVVTSFSARGPTADGRIKPDVTAMGRSVYLVAFGNDSTYVRASGTSFSAPLTTGVVALLLEAHPGWGPYEVREALRETALNHAAPNNDIGWGLVQGRDAYAWLPSTVDVPAPAAPSGLTLSLSPNPLAGDAALTVRFTLPEPAACRLRTIDLAGRVRATLDRGVASGAQSLRLPLAGDGGRLAPGVYWIRLEARAGSAVRTASRRLVVAP